MILEEVGKPLVLSDIPPPRYGESEVLIQVDVCGVCRTDLHILDGELFPPSLPLILGHQVVGTVVEKGSGVTHCKIGDKVGVPWLGRTCGECRYCRAFEENLCDRALFTGFNRNGGFAEFCAADAAFVVPLPADILPLQTAPLLCAGVIGFRTLTMIPEAKKIGFYGFGSSAHLLAQVVTTQGKQFYAFTRPGDTVGQNFARTLGATWAGGSDELPPEPLDAAILFAPLGPLFPQALQAVKKGGTVISAGIHMTDIPSFSYDLLWEERVMRSVSNLTREDARAFFQLARQINLKPEVTPYPLERLNEAVDDMRGGRVKGSVVIEVRL